MRRLVNKGGRKSGPARTILTINRDVAHAVHGGRPRKRPKKARRRPSLATMTEEQLQAGLKATGTKPSTGLLAEFQRGIGRAINRDIIADLSRGNSGRGFRVPAGTRPRKARAKSVRLVVDAERVADEQLLALIRDCGGVAGVAYAASLARPRYNAQREARLLDALAKWAAARGAE